MDHLLVMKRRQRLPNMHHETRASLVRPKPIEIVAHVCTVKPLLYPRGSKRNFIEFQLHNLAEDADNPGGVDSREDFDLALSSLEHMKTVRADWQKNYLSNSLRALKLAIEYVLLPTLS